MTGGASPIKFFCYFFLKFFAVYILPLPWVKAAHGKGFAVCPKRAHGKGFAVCPKRAHSKTGFAGRYLPCALCRMLHMAKPLPCA